MDYKYIEQLMERYFHCQTTLQEEQILRSFFQQEDIPAELLPYRDLFRYQNQEAQQETLGDDFDAKVLSVIEEPVTVKAKRISLKSYLNPLFKAAAMVAIFLTVGNAAQRSFTTNEEKPATTASPEMTYQKSQSPLEMVSEDMKATKVGKHGSDSLDALKKTTNDIN